MIGRCTQVTPDPEILLPRQGDVRDSQASVSNARDLLGFSARTAFEEGLRLTV